MGEFTQDAYPPQDAVWSPSAPWAQQQSQGSWSQTTEDGSARDKGLSGAGPASEPLPLPHAFSAPDPTTDAWSGHIGYPYPYADHRSVSPSSLSTGSARRHASPPRTAPETSWIQAPAPHSQHLCLPQSNITGDTSSHNNIVRSCSIQELWTPH